MFIQIAMFIIFFYSRSDDNVNKCNLNLKFSNIIRPSLAHNNYPNPYLLG